MVIMGYIGPGLGGGIIAIVVGVLFSIFLAIVSFFWRPIKKVIKHFQSKKSE